MECFRKSHDLLPAIVKGSQLQGILIGLSSRIAKEELIVFPAGDLSQFGGQLLLEGDADGIGIEPYFIQLVGEAADVVRMGMADGYYCMTTVQVQVLLTLLVPYVRAFGFYNGDVIDGIDVE